MIKKPTKPKKAKLKCGVDATDLVEKLKKLLNEGHAIMEQPFIDEKDFDNWYYQVLSLLETSFTEPDNEHKRRFVGPASYILFSQDGVPPVQPDMQFEIKQNLGEQLSSLEIIIDDIRIRLVKPKKIAAKKGM